MPPQQQSKRRSKPMELPKDQDGKVAELQRIRARSPKALARWTPVPLTPDPCTSTSSSATVNQCEAAKSSTGFLEESVKATPHQCQEVQRIFKKLQQEIPYIDLTCQNPEDDGGMTMDSKRLMFKLDQRSKELEELMHEGQELLQGYRTPRAGAPSSPTDSPAKRLRIESDDGFISFSNCIDELCQQLDILGKECQLRHSEGFATPSHSRTPERLQLLAETKDVLDAVQQMVTGVADAHREAEGLALAGEPSSLSRGTSVPRQLNLRTSKTPKAHNASDSLGSERLVHFHLDDKLLEDGDKLGKSASSTSSGWTDFNIDELPEDGLNALESARCRLQSAYKLSESEYTLPGSQVAINSSPNQKATSAQETARAGPSHDQRTSRAPGSGQNFTVQRFPQVEEMCEVLCQRRKMLVGLEDRISVKSFKSSPGQNAEKCALKHKFR